jgi:cytochrome c biogenesis protein CcmG/thiol:disulfide interchange protein DsbE
MKQMRIGSALPNRDAALHPTAGSAIIVAVWYRAFSALLCLLLLVGCDRGSRPARIGTPAPDFTIQDADRKVTLSQFRGDVVVLNFWATWCTTCTEELPSLMQLQSRLRDKGVVVLGVSWDEDNDLYHKFLQTYKIDFLTVREGSPKIGNMYGTIKIPETYIIDRTGKIRRKFISAVDWNDPDVVSYLSQL